MVELPAASTGESVLPDRDAKAWAGIVEVGGFEDGTAACALDIVVGVDVGMIGAKVCEGFGGCAEGGVDVEGYPGDQLVDVVVGEMADVETKEGDASNAVDDGVEVFRKVGTVGEAAGGSLEEAAVGG